MFFPLTLPREGRGSPRVSRKKKRPRPLHFFESFKTLTLTQFVNALTVFPHYSPVLLEMGPDLKMKEKQQRLRLVCVLCVCVRVCVRTLSREYYRLQQFAVIGNALWAWTCSLDEVDSQKSGLLRCCSTSQTSAECFFFFCFFPLHRHTWFLKDAPSQALIHIHTINSSQWVTLCANVHQHTHPEWEWLIALVVAHPVQF